MAISTVGLTNAVNGVLPVANGGTGTTSYSASQWTTSGSDIYYNTGNVGIGTSSPNNYGKLAVAGTIAAGADQTDQVSLLGGGGTGRVEATGGNASVNLALSAKGGGAVYFWRGGYGGTNTMIIDASSNLQFNSGYGSVATAYGCRAWVNFYAAGASIRASGGVSSITRNGTGDYTINFSITFPDTSYAPVLSGMRYEVSNGSLNTTLYGNTGALTYMTTTSVRVLAENDSGTRVDPFVYTAAIFR